MGGQFVIFAYVASLPPHALPQADAVAPQAARDKLLNATNKIIQQADYTVTFCVSRRGPKALAGIAWNTGRVPWNFSRAQHA
jgi:hypothetical protein